MLSGINLIKSNCFWEIGNGDNIDVREDFWISNTKPPINKSLSGTAGITKVSHLFTSNKTWDYAKLTICTYY